MPIVLNGRRAKRDGDWQKTLDWQLAVAKLKFLTVANLDVAITKDWVFGILSAVLTTNQRVDLR
ncbi:MAG TPA: hypothetical protein P5307_15680, partial [Pirellulaceae bacterium]|nr:hypothetical protein [Pirellulaceae bacterium]